MSSFNYEIDKKYTHIMDVFVSERDDNIIDQFKQAKLKKWWVDKKCKKVFTFDTENTINNTCSEKSLYIKRGTLSECKKSGGVVNLRINPITRYNNNGDPICGDGWKGGQLIGTDHLLCWKINTIGPFITSISTMSETDTRFDANWHRSNISIERFSECSGPIRFLTWENGERVDLPIDISSDDFNQESLINTYGVNNTVNLSDCCIKDPKQINVSGAQDSTICNKLYNNPELCRIPIIQRCINTQRKNDDICSTDLWDNDKYKVIRKCIADKYCDNIDLTGNPFCKKYYSINKPTGIKVIKKKCIDNTSLPEDEDKFCSKDIWNDQAYVDIRKSVIASSCKGVKLDKPFCKKYCKDNEGKCEIIIKSQCFDDKENTDVFCSSNIWNDNSDYITTRQNLVKSKCISDGDGMSTPFCKKYCDITKPKPDICTVVPTKEELKAKKRRVIIIIVVSTILLLTIIGFVFFLLL